MERSVERHSPISARLSSVHAAMDAALAAARLGVRGANPLVGAAVLAPDGTIVTGHHRGAGTPHAEPDALAAARSAGIDLAASLVCVTLEPCSHHGRTGPCADLLIEAGVPEVVIALADPNPSAAGGCARLRDAGVTVRTGVREAEARALNARWLGAVDEHRPFTTLKIAQSLDGRIAAADGTSQWITSPASRERVHTLRARVDAVVVGTGTAHADDPRLTARTGTPATQPARTTRSTPVAHSDPAARPDHSAQPAALTQPIPVVVGMRDLAPDSHLARDPRTVHLRTHDPLAALQALRTQGLEHVLVEGGAHLAGAFLRAGVVDELELHIAPLLLGDGLPGLAGLGVTTLADAVRWVPDDTPAGVSHSASRPNPDTILRLRPADSPAEATPTTGSTTTPTTAQTTTPATEPTKGR
ncbi:bifunctional diaminohydroxyphosphoribosylaminopyrimidine deaminase/5-amino-6-(5-phosphoribosylamino)uracil reductase RibD [Brevibacterium jeotgali]|uniref:Riboflavin biosynthesis protein RibD n=1 Tax=Brevibacterium jeotgali TaxID=1262550 RepID=A0A2H1L1H4_9MICO|nr:bifunctional diaminohydroxyphosphoribosylaminopyrimidine deaminase/5-amino-6-(5-phosphoribosylamino)uracil reductase RibD [Brevibacterium jeotgali]TWC01892.1 diaminohydroxyphosphoribosylaminopyrimidine deaminase/5-amino-6-(5-phosphoribosylamino)uracil reductase [Brevibacterium jeotgali]SMY10757.1 diaminohydroxyphosphoribosylaminopyrimidine deaminaseuracil reductase [Brevibacterium jeotgali]